MRHWESEIFTFGQKDGRLIHINNVKNGLKCECICPACKGALIAVNNIKSFKLRPHFRHLSTTNCSQEHYKESTVHLLAKEIVKENRYLFIPKVDFMLSYDYRNYITVINPDDLNAIDNLPKYLKQKSAPFKLLYESIETEKRLRNVTPDILALVKGKTLIVEIAFTHFVEESKLAMFKRNNIDAIEINLSAVSIDSGIEAISQALFNINNIKWLHNTRLVKKLQQTMLKALNVRDFLSEHSRMLKTYANMTRVYDCPLESNRANQFILVNDQCDNCRFMLGKHELINYKYEQFKMEKAYLEDEGKSTTHLAKKYGAEIKHKNGLIGCVGHLKQTLDGMIDAANR